MTEQHMNMDPNELNDAARLRALADGEIARDDVPDADERGLAFEAALKDSVSRVMGEEVRAPDALRSSIEAMFAQESGSSVPTVESEPQEDVGVVETPMGDTTDRSFWAGPVARLLPVAAVLALVVTLVGFGASGFLGSQTPDAPFELTRASNITEFVPRAHTFSMECSPEEFAAKFNERGVDGAVAFAGSYLGGLGGAIREKIDNLERAGFEFAGMGRCAVPGEGKSVHAYFRQPGAESSVSVFIQQIENDAFDNMCEKHCFGAACDAGGADNLYVWKCSGLLHYIYSPDASVTEDAKSAIQAPAKVASLLP
ncbi:MAG: hypothetical protein AAGH64_10720 [Planctomycetota bacterium]